MTRMLRKDFEEFMRYSFVQPDKIKFEVLKRNINDGLWESMGLFEPIYEVEFEERQHRFLFWTWTETIETVKRNPTGEKVNIRSAIAYARQLWKHERREIEPMDVRVVVHGYPVSFDWWKNGRFCDSY